MYYVYTLKCCDGNLYTGCTKDLKERIKRHTMGHVPATASRLPVGLVSYTTILEKQKAFDFEKYLKSGSGRAFFKKRMQ